MLLAVMLMVAFAVPAQTYDVADVPNVRLKDKRLYVSDPEGVLSQVTVQSINTMLATLEDSTSIEVAVVVVPSVPDGDCFTFAHQLGQQWGVGKKGRDNGLVILLATEDRCVQMVTGYGLEGDLPDAICKRIQTQWMNPHFARGEWNEGLFYGVKAVCDRLQGTMSPDAEGEGGSSGFAWIFIGGILAVIVIGIVASRISDWRSRKCPRCGRHKLFPMDVSTVSETPAYKVVRRTLICQHCGQVVTREKKIRKDGDNHFGGGGFGPIFWGGFFGSGGGRGGGFGGFGGGSFGGGSFGGGGAGSKF